MPRRLSATPAEDGLCVDPAALSFAQPPCRGKLIPAKDLSGNITAANQALYDKLIDSFSMRSFVPSPGWSGHDQFFATFGKFGGLTRATLANGSTRWRAARRRRTSSISN